MSIQIQAGTAPEVKNGKVKTAIDFDEIVNAAKSLTGTRWFIVPNTEGKTMTKTAYIRRKIKAALEIAKVTGIIVEHTEGDQGVLVKRVVSAPAPKAK